MLRLENIHTYYGKSHILHGIGLEVGSGQVVALLGRNGVGKTTTMRTIMGLTPPKSGSCTFNNSDITKLPPYERAMLGLGYVPEQRQIFPRLTVLENLRIGLDLRRLGEAEKNRNLDMVFKSFPRLKERLNQAGQTLSGGEQQMLAMARAVVIRPRLILLDEPTEGLMPRLVREIADIVGWMADELGIAVLLIEQDYKLCLRASSRCYVMEKGRISYEGASAKLADDPERLRTLLGVA